LGTVISFADDRERPRAEVVLDNGDHVLLVLDRSGLTISHIGRSEPATISFQADAETVAHLCASLLTPGSDGAPTPLRILVAAVTQFTSAALVARAFADAVAQMPDARN
jgi:hypothetical protein